MIESSRVEFVDVTRGLLFLLMASTHALTLAGVGKSSFLWGQFWLPNGWATTSFIMLSGLTIPLVYRWKDTAFNIVKVKVYGRAKEILIVMFLSNIVMLLLKMVVQGRTVEALDGKWWMGLLTFSTSYSISAILIPTGLLMLFAPYLVKSERKLGWKGFGLASLGLVYFLWSIKAACTDSPNRLLQLLFSDGVGGFPVIPFIGLGVVGMSVGFIVSQKFSKNKTFGVLLVSLGVLVAQNVLVILMQIDTVEFRSVSRFSFLCCLGVLLTHVNGFGYFKLYFSLIGRYALFSFLFHRVILQVVALLLSVIPVAIENETKYLVLLLATMSLIGCLCLARQRVKWFDITLRKLYL